MQILPVNLKPLGFRTTWKVSHGKYSVNIRGSPLRPRGAFALHWMRAWVRVCHHPIVVSKQQGLSAPRSPQRLCKLKSERMAQLGSNSRLRAGIKTYPWAAARPTSPSALKLASYGRSCWAGLAGEKESSSGVDVTGDTGGRYQDPAQDVMRPVQMACHTNGTESAPGEMKLRQRTWEPDTRRPGG